MKRFSIYVCLTLTACMLVPAMARAEVAGQIICEKRSNIVAGLATEYSEAPVSMGYTKQGTILEILASPNGNWTMIETLPSGKTCLVASGELWQDTTLPNHRSNTAL